MIKLAGPALAIAALFSLPALAQTYPERNMTLVVPLAAGGSADVVGRLIAQHMSERLGRPMVVENVSGAGGMIGADRVAKAAPDGYRILFGTLGTQAQNQTLYKEPLYDSTTAFEAIGLAVEVPIILQVTNSFPARTPAEVIAYIKANAAKLNFGSPGAGSANHLACALFNTTIGVEVTHVAYKEASQLMQDVVTGQSDYWCPTTTAAAPLIQANQVRTIMAFSHDRLETLPSVPTAIESGLADFEAGTWFGLFLPKGAPAAVVKTLNEALNKSLDDPALRARLRETGVTAVGAERRSPDYLSRFVISEIQKWAGPIRASKVSM